MSQLQESAIVDGTWTVNQTVSAHPEAVAVFTRFGIDACCGGSATIEAAARRHGVDAVALLHAIRQATESR